MKDCDGKGGYKAARECVSLCWQLIRLYVWLAKTMQIVTIKKPDKDL